MAESADSYKKKEGKLPNLYNPIDGNRIVRAVPLVYYEGLERHVVGTAILREDGTFTAQVYPENQPRVKEILEDRSLSQMAFAFRPPLMSLADEEDADSIVRHVDDPNGEKEDWPLPPVEIQRGESMADFIKNRKAENENRPLPDDPAYD